MTGPHRPEVVVVGRSDFHTGIGTVSAAALELFGRTVDVGFWSPREGLPEGSTVTTPAGRTVPVVQPHAPAVTFFTDVLWNGYSDANYAAVPSTGLRVAHMAYDSDELPTEWVRILNSTFDLALFSSAYLVDVARHSGVTIPVGTLPIGLDIEPLLARRYRPASTRRIRFGTVSAYHSRKNLDLLVEAFLEAFGDDSTVELVIHSNLEIGDTFARVSALAADAPVKNIRLSTGNLSEADKNDLIDSFDVYVNVSAGEGYSIGPREAQALGKTLVLSRIPAHDDMGGPDGVFFVDPAGRRPAAYPEIENRVLGRQAILTPTAISGQLERAAEFAASAEAARTARDRKQRAAEFSNTRLEADYTVLIDPQSAAVRRRKRGSRFTSLPAEAAALGIDAVGRHATRLRRRRVVVPVHDGGFFSIFNTFLSHLTWGLEDSSISMVLPDWDAGRLIQRSGDKSIVSFCYGQPDEGNSWLSLFEPLFDLSAEEMNSEEFLYSGSELPHAEFNQDREPNLTYVNAHNLYLSREFRRIRKQYRAALDDHIRLVPHLRAELDAATGTSFDERFTVGVHVKHPSHAIEQPGQRIADRYAYVDRVRQELRDSGVDENSDDWGVFVATDQDRVVQLFVEEFGHHVIRFDDVTRTDAAVDDRFDTLSDDEKLLDGHQLQHQMASNTSTWSSRLAWEVWRDADVLSRCTSVIHAVSNVSTAVAFMNPETNMRYFEV